MSLPTAIILMVVAVAMWIPDFIAAADMGATACRWLYLPVTIDTETNAILIVAVTLLLTLLNALLLMSLLYTAGATRERSLLPLVVYVFLTSAITELHYLPSFQVALIFISLMLALLYKVYRQPFATEEVFLATLLLLIGSMFAPDFLWLILFIWIGLVSERAMSMRSLLASLIAIVVVGSVVALIEMLTIGGIIGEPFANLINRSLITIDLSPLFIGYALLALISIILVIYYFSTRTLLNVKHIVAYDLFVGLMIVVFIFTIWRGDNSLNLYPLGLFAFSALISHYFLNNQSIARGVLFILYFVAQIAFFIIRT